MNTRITLVTPSFNQGRYLDEAIRSVVSQRTDIHEYFVLDGGSTDGSAGIIQRHAAQLDWWVSERDAGQTAAIARGFRRATGDVLAWLNSDDIYLPGALAAVRAAFDADPGLDLLTGYMVFIDPSSRIDCFYRVPAPGRVLRRLGHLYVTQPTTFFRRALYERVGGLDTHFHCGMDSDLWARFYMARPVWRTLPIYLVGFRRHPDAKGKSTAWAGIYAEENKLLLERYAWIARGWRKQMALLLYRTAQIVGGAQLRARLDTCRHRGRPVGEWAAEQVARPVGCRHT